MSKSLLLLSIEPADRAMDHSPLCTLARKSTFTRDFSAMWFSGREAYEKGWIRVARVAASDPHCPLDEDEIAGFTCVRHRKRQPLLTTLYFIGVDPRMRGRGVGKMLLDDMHESSPHSTFELKVSHDNPDALRFYQREGYLVSGHEDEFWVMRRTFE